MRAHRIAFLELGIAALFIAACSSNSSSSTTPDGGASPDAAPPPATFTQVYTSVITAHCGPCHTTATGEGVTGGKLDMTSQSAAYTNLVGVAAAGDACAGKGTRVVPSQPDQSIMYLKASDDDPAPCGSKMPLGSQGLDKGSSDLCEGWSSAGAPNN
jgi:hypothetical protein